jgi:hypothetical protein
MVANTHNTAPATTHETPMYPKVTISATQANTCHTLIGYPSEERGRLYARDDPVFTDCPTSAAFSRGP